MTEHEIFEQARNLLEQDRLDFLDKACGSDDSMKSRIVSQLKHSDRKASGDCEVAGVEGDSSITFAKDNLNQTSDWMAGKGNSANLQMRQVGPYRVIELLGEGGMGSVWKAEQAEPVKRAVALKVIRQGLSSSEVLTRFEAERQALAIMNHPNIARIIDAGTTPDGSPYFAMELVEGPTFIDYCDQNQLSIEERLELFAQVCAGVQHAHQKGIIHRDLKPSNILVIEIDGQPIPKVIDFGLAKAIDNTQRLTDQTQFTGVGQILGTVKYMSPEQAQLDSVDVDTRTDIYSLGVILYELLTGFTPLDKFLAKGDGLLRLLEIVREYDPDKPSSQLSRRDNPGLSKITLARSTDSIRLGKALVGDLDWVVMKALEKEQSRRYDSATGLANDIKRYLAHEPVSARPPSMNYRIGKFIKKNRIGVTAAAFLLLALIGGTIGTSIGMVRAESARKDAVKAKNAEAKRAITEAKAKDRAQKRLEQVERGIAVLGGIFEDLDIRRIKLGEDPIEVVLAARLIDAGEKLDGQSIGDPLSVAELKNTLGTSLLSLGFPDAAQKLFQDALPLLEKHLGADGIITMTCRRHLASSLNSMERFDEALQINQQNLEYQKSKLGVEHRNTLVTLNNLAGQYKELGDPEKAVEVWEETLDLRMQHLGAEDPDTLQSMNSLGFGLMALDRHDEAEAIFTECLKKREKILGPEHYDTLVTMGNLATCYDSLMQYEKALPLLEKTCEHMAKNLGKEHPHTLIANRNYAEGLKNAGYYGKASDLMFENVELAGKIHGEYHPTTMQSRIALTWTLQKAKRHDESLMVAEQLLDDCMAEFGENHPMTFSAQNALADVYVDFGKAEDAVKIWERTLPMSQNNYGPSHETTLMLMNQLALGYKSINRFNESLEMYEKTLELKKEKYPPEHSEITVSMNNLAFGYLSAGKISKALPLYEATLVRVEKTYGPTHPFTTTTLRSMSKAYVSAEKFDRAIELAKILLDRTKQRLGDDHRESRDAVLQLASTYNSSRRYADAIPILLGYISESESFKHSSLARSYLRKAYLETGATEKFSAAIKRDLKLARESFSEQSVELASHLTILGTDFSDAGNYESAIALLRESLSIRRKRLSKNWATFNTESLLGYALFKQSERLAKNDVDSDEESNKKLYLEAKELMSHGLKGLNDNMEMIPQSVRESRLAQARERLLHLAKATDDEQLLRILND